MGGSVKSTKRQNVSMKDLYPAKLSFKSEGESKTHPDKQKLREFMITRPGLQLKGDLQDERDERTLDSNSKPYEYKSKYMGN